MGGTQPSELDRLGSLERHYQSYVLVHICMSVLNWLMSDRVGEKWKINYVYPVGGEFVLDIDVYWVWRLHLHRVGVMAFVQVVLIMLES